MKYGEDQLTHGFRAGGFEADWQVSTAIRGIMPAQIGSGNGWSAGSYAESLSEGKWQRVQILSLSQDRAFVHYLARGDQWDESVPASGLRPVPKTRYSVGQR